MSRHSYLTVQRIRLDRAITYGTKREACELARKYLKEAADKGLVSEVEYFKGQIDLLNGRFASAIEHFDEAIRLNPKDGAAYNDRALCMVELGIIDESFKYFDKGIKVEPDYATIYHNKGWLLNNIGRHSEAIRYFKKALELEPDRPVTYDNLADALLNLGDKKGALSAYKKVIKQLNPKSLPQIRKQINILIGRLEDELKDH